MTEPPLLRELDELLSELVDDTLTPEKHRRLENLLSTSQKARSRYLTYIDNQTGLEKLHCRRETEPNADFIARMEQLNNRRSSRFKSTISTIALSIAAVCTLILVAQGLFIRPKHVVAPIAETAPETGPKSVRKEIVPSTPPRQARLTQAAGAELFGLLLPPIGSSLHEHEEYTLIRGAMELTFPNGAIALIESPAVFVIESNHRLKLKTGGCSVHAPEGAEGFEILTPHSRVVDIGTRFSINVNEIGTSEVHVIEGAAEVYSAANSQEMKLLRQGEARLSTDSDSLSHIPFNKSLYRRSLPDRVIEYEATPDEADPAYVKDLVNVTIQRGGNPYTYQADEMIGVDVIDFVAEGDSACLAWVGEFPSDPADALRNRALDTGLCNFGTIAASRLSNEKRKGEYPSQAGTPRMALRFHRPVMNGPGPDIVLFDVQPAIHDPQGDAFYVRPLTDFKGARQHHVARFDITMNSRNALRIQSLRLAEYDRAPQSLNDFFTIHYRWKPLIFPFYVLAVGIDLSDLGYAAGAECDGLVLEDGNDDRNFLDPVFIGGLPAIPVNHFKETRKK